MIIAQTDKCKIMLVFMNDRLSAKSMPGSNNN